MDNETFEEARWLSVYGATVALQAHRMKIDHGRDPDQADVDYFVKQATALANMVSNSNPKR